MENIKNLYNEWLEKATGDPDLIEELEGIKDNDDEILDRFYRSLEFGTAGLRGVIGAGTNRMNIYTVGRATQGLSDFLNKNYENPSIAIGYDSRIKSEYFSREAAGILAANGIKVYIYEEQMEVVEKTLKDISANDKPIYVIFNKIDSYQNEEYDDYSLEPRTERHFTLDEVKSKWMERNIPCIFVSALKKEGINKLKDDIYKMVAEIHAGRYPFNNFLW